VDGGVTKDNIKEVADCGANLLVAGSAVFKNGEIEKNIKVLREAL
jgi:ribulose-phosphate 3-epimerase